MYKIRNFRAFSIPSGGQLLKTQVISYNAIEYINDIKYDLNSIPHLMERSWQLIRTSCGTAGNFCALVPWRSAA